MKKKSGNSSEGKSSDGFVKTFFSVRHATPEATGESLLMSAASRSPASANAASAIATMPITTAIPNPSASACRVPARDDQAAHALDQVRDRVDPGDEAEPLDLDQVAGRVHRRDEEEDEEQREDALDRLARAGAEREEEADRAEADRDTRREEQQHDDPERAGGEFDADEQADGDVERRLDETEHDDAAELARDQRDAAHRGQREPVQEAGLDVAGEVGAGVHGREERPWMNGTASAKATNESVGKPGSCVEASSPPELTSRSSSGKTSGETTAAGWRACA